MSFFELFLIAVGLSMDAFAVSISNGLSIRKILLRKAVAIAFAFGFFQGLMPLIGYFLSSSFSEWISRWDHFIALGLLAIIGGKMLIEGIGELNGKGVEENDKKRLSFLGLLLQAVATSIDALIVGVGFAAMNVEIIPAVAFIATVTFCLSLIGVYAGKRFGDMLGSKAEVLGGIILIGIGIKVFIEHTFF